jgi:transcriptional regulator with XRE-family HTH domain
MRTTRKGRHHICELLRALRTAAGLSLHQIEAKHGIKAVVIGSWERGDRQPTLRQVDEALGFYGYELRAVPRSESTLGNAGTTTLTNEQLVMGLSQLIARLQAEGGEEA